MPFKFIHTADLHFDSPLRSLALKDPELADIIAVASRRAFGKIVDLCLELKADALLISGDTYDGEVASAKSAVFLAEKFRQLNASGIRVFMILGNHDAESRISKLVPLPDNVHVFKGRRATVEIGDRGVAIHGVSFSSKHAPDSLLPKFPKPKPGLFNIGMLHTSLAGSASHDRYAPCTLPELVDFGYDYWALGHIHKRQIHSEQPFVVMPGIPQGRDIGESGRKSVTSVEVGDDGIARMQEHFTAFAQFEVVEVDVSECSHHDEVRLRMRAALEAARLDAKAEHLVARVIFTGESPMHWHLKRNSDLLLEEARAIADSTDDLWVEKIEAAALPQSRTVTEADPVHELQSIMEDSVDDAHFLKLAAAEYDALVKQFPTVLQRKWRSDETEGELLRRLIREGCNDVVAALNDRGDAG